MFVPLYKIPNTIHYIHNTYYYNKVAAYVMSIKITLSIIIIDSNSFQTRNTFYRIKFLRPEYPAKRRSQNFLSQHYCTYNFICIGI